MVFLEGFDINILFTQFKLFQIVLHNSLCMFHSICVWWYARDCVVFDFSSIHYHLLFFKLRILVYNHVSFQKLLDKMSCSCEKPVQNYISSH